MFADRGYEAVTLRAIAKQIGYTHAVIYQHFPDKWHILAELSSETIRLLIQNFDAIAARSRPLQMSGMKSRQSRTFAREPRVRITSVAFFFQRGALQR